jgi:hypothetical protein
MYFIKLATELLATKLPEGIPCDMSLKQLEKVLPPDFVDEYPTYMALVTKYGIPVVGDPETDKIKPIHVYLDYKTISSTVKLRILPSINVLHLKGLVSRQLRIPPRQLKLSIIDKETHAIMDIEDDLKSITYYNLSDGDTIIIAKV